MELKSTKCRIALKFVGQSVLCDVISVGAFLTQIKRKKLRLCSGAIGDNPIKKLSSKRLSLVLSFSSGYYINLDLNNATV
jgi:hypothetical protein